MALTLIVFDCDGVILESMDIKSRAFYNLGKEFGDEAAERLMLYHRMHGGVSRYKKFEWLFAEYAGRPITDDEKTRLNEKFVALAYEEITHCALVPGIEDVLGTWKGRVPLYVASGAPENELRLVLEKRGLASYFNGIFGSPPAKSRLLRSIVKHAGAQPQDAVMVGDSQADLSAAEAVGTRFYGRGEYFKHTPHPWHTDLTQLSGYLETLAHEA